jgi:hypothetical protein
MPRAVAILKYAPALMCGLLVVAWFVSVTFPIGCRYRMADEMFVTVILHCGTVAFWYDSHSIFGPSTSTGFRENKGDFHWAGWLGAMEVHWAAPSSQSRFSIPLPLAMSVTLPLAGMPFLRFPLWSYFAWTALVAGELAYYLAN